MKVTAFNGSARKDGNTSVLIKSVFTEIEKEGIQTELVNLSGKKIGGCIACFKCFENKNKRCSIKDDAINECIEKMIEADGIILASPTYFSNVSAEMKALIDRAGLVAFANTGMLRHKVGAAVTVARRTGASQALMAMNTFFSCFEMFTVGSNYPNMAIGLNKGDVEQDSMGLETMKTLGTNIAFLLKKLNHH
jgi:multimeric flavodoxin WrbA